MEASRGLHDGDSGLSPFEITSGIAYGVYKGLIDIKDYPGGIAVQITEKAIRQIDAARTLPILL